MRLFIMIVMAFLFVGCAIKTPPTTEYLLHTTKEISKKANSKCSSKTLKILEPNSVLLYKQEAIWYVKESVVGSYNFSKWVEAPSDMIYSELLDHIRQSNLFATVASYNSLQKSNYLLEVDLLDFKQYFDTTQQSSFVKVALTLTLIDKVSMKPLTQKSFSYKIKTKSADAQGGVEAFRTALEQFLDDAILWISEQCV